MSAPQDRHGLPIPTSTPLHKRSQSHNNTTKLAIRVVPYTPPKLDPEARLSGASSLTQQAPARDSGNYVDQSFSSDVRRSRGSWLPNEVTEDYATSSPGSAFTSPSVTSLSLAQAKEEGVSVSRIAVHSGPPGSRGRTMQRPARSHSSSDVSTPINASATHGAFRGDSPASTSSVASPGSRPRPLSRKRNVIALHGDGKTFSLVRAGQQPHQPDVSTSVASPQFSQSSRDSSRVVRSSVDAWNEDRTGSPFTGASSTVIDNSLSDADPFVPTPSPGSSTTELAEDPIKSSNSSPWNYRMVGGLRKVPNNPDLKQKASRGSTIRRLSTPASELPLPSLPEAADYKDSDETFSRTVLPKASFTSAVSAQTVSTTSETTNYKVYGHSSFVQESDDSLPLPPSSSSPNIRVLGESSPEPTSTTPPETSDGDENYVLHGSSPFTDENYVVHDNSSPTSPTSPIELNYIVHETSSPASVTEKSDSQESSPSTIPNYIVHEVSTPSTTQNYVVHAASSPISRIGQSDSQEASPSSNENYVVHARSTPSNTSENNYPSQDSSPFNNENYVLHGDPSPSSSLATISRQPRPTYSQESLVVPPLRPAKKRSYEKFGYYKQRSRESLRARSGSLQSIKSISSVITGQNSSPAFLAAPALIDFGASSSRAAGSTQNQASWSNQQTPGASTGSSTTQGATTQRPAQMQAHPHQWSSQLSTVASESEGDSDLLSSRSLTPSTGNGHHRQRSSNGRISVHSRHMHSISSSLSAQLEESSSGSDVIDRPQPAYSRGGSQVVIVRDQDEHGDGLADLHERPSRTGLAALFEKSSGSFRSSHSRGSSRTNSLTSRSRANSFTSSIPAWAKVYYGSGERRFLGAPSITVSEAHDSRPASSVLSNNDSPNPDHFPVNIFSPRKRAREVSQEMRPLSDSGSMEITPAPAEHQNYGIIRTLKHKTSSIWSPHLRMDRRATRYSVWDPPSVSWSADTGILGKRNAQVVLFIFGFIFPFTWMIAAVLPLPPGPSSDIEEGDNRGKRPKSEFTPRAQPIDETRFESARWWRNLNRIMSVVGLLLLGAVIALVVIGLREGWATS